MRFESLDNCNVGLDVYEGIKLTNQGKLAFHCFAFEYVLMVYHWFELYNDGWSLLLVVDDNIEICPLFKILNFSLKIVDAAVTISQVEADTDFLFGFMFFLDHLIKNLARGNVKIWFLYDCWCFCNRHSSIPSGGVEQDVGQDDTQDDEENHGTHWRESSQKHVYNYEQ